jgi:hypothetical protein
MQGFSLPLLLFQPRFILQGADDPWLKQAYGRPVGRNDVSREVVHIQNGLLCEIQLKFGGATIGMALDGRDEFKVRCVDQKGGTERLYIKDEKHRICQRVQDALVCLFPCQGPKRKKQSGWAVF